MIPFSPRPNQPSTAKSLAFIGLHPDPTRRRHGGPAD